MTACYPRPSTISLRISRGSRFRLRERVSRVFGVPEAVITTPQPVGVLMCGPRFEISTDRARASQARLATAMKNQESHSEEWL
jgi:hypothetical protein